MVRDAIKVVLILLAVGGLGSGFIYLVLPERTVVELLRQGGYWFILLVVLLFGMRAIQLGRETVLKHKLRLSWPALLPVATIVFVFTLMLVHERFEYKILIDEPVLVGTSQQMHLKRQVLAGERAHIIDGEYVILNSFVDKRPLLFPFLVSMVHDVSGYRMENAFILNACLLLVLLIVLYALGYLLSGRRSGGILAVLLVANIPHLARTANGAGFELLNFLLLCLLFWAMWFYLEKTDKLRLDVLCLLTVLLSQARYETVVFVPAVGLVIVIGWWRKRQVVTSPVLYLTPLLFLPYLMRHRVFSSKEKYWQMWDRPDMEHLFSLSYIPDNIGHALNYFLNFSADMPNSYLLFLMGAVAMLFVAIRSLRNIRDCRQMPVVQIALMAFFIGFLIWFLLMMSYAFGQFDDIIVTRLALPLYVAFLLAVVYALYRFQPKPWLVQATFVATIFCLVLYAMPTIATAHLSNAYTPSKEILAVDKLRQKTGDDRFLLIARMPIHWITHEIESISIARANTRKEALKYYLNQPSSPPVYVFDTVKFDHETGEYVTHVKDGVPEPSMVLDDDFVVETVVEYHVNAIVAYRIRRLVDVKVDLPETGPYESGSHFLGEWALYLP